MGLPIFLPHLVPGPQVQLLSWPDFFLGALRCSEWPCFVDRLSQLTTSS